MTDRTQDLHYMTLALRLAAKGRGTTSPNPMVGAVVVKQGRIVGQGFHLRPGTPHAEILALRRAGTAVRGATLYVTLEPCCHLKKRTPPCVPEVLRSGVSRVVIAMPDPNPAVERKGVAALRRAGLSVTVGVAQSEAEELNKAYCLWVKTGRPYVTLKAGMTLDGQLATASGESRWITGELSRREVHQIRGHMDAVLVGVGTVLIDDPALTARTGAGLETLASRQPLRIVVDSRLRTPLKAQVLAQQNKAKTMIVTTAAASAARRSALQQKGIEVLTVPGQQGRVSLPALLKQLGRRGVTSLLVEGGSEMNGAMLKARLVNHVRLYVAPRLLGGQNAKGMIGGVSPAKLAAAIRLRQVVTRSLGNDWVVEGDL
ncbi:MAG: bifunctional diaminohydroxyphosphoribosylaminopyrimidine deaminase/5-amino-6-(5-phosphoribosylamino)uracil reductase RibD [Nitrospira sp.]|nr:bifunctional diaminohydroxyphosphoribosylaminopyrimidine deaminase/5-amino-6-(5-phosphoribosylamino)uracil reductase RibD [Nitrospira sp.]MDH4303940.1 bifunctional diaminohydroxyphosphoribosylaminopyrimidine deaminase/5-amino-6-(5-phosphoribosylamino)uracil reductase RibD [Nitrospira sp.]MDH5195020.1 bifunctional diaminohydroxyphosphoribosylaminopyrimidine deaminase/5-amino-6-(5-phosphoribosylamino)uracil reductase RibD [Nitrospira sp.]